MDEDDLAAELRGLRQTVESLETRVEALEDEVGADGSESADADEQPAVASLRNNDESDEVTDEGDESDESDEGDGRSGLVGTEFDVGVKWIGLAGAAALIAATVFFVQLAIERGYLGPLARVLLGTATGVAMLAGGRYVTRARDLAPWGRIVAGAGFVVAYFALYASYAFESYRVAIGQPLWLSVAAMTALVVATVTVSVRDDDPAIAGGSVVFGFVTAALLAGEFDPVTVPGYVLGLTLALVAVAAVRPWRRVLAVGTVAAYAVVVRWGTLEAVSAGEQAGLAGAVFVCFVAGTALVRRTDPSRAEGAATGTTLTAGLNGLLAIGLFYGLFDAGDPRGYGALSLVAVASLATYVAATERWDRAAHAEPFLALLALYLATTLALPAAIRLVSLVVVAVAAVASVRRLADRRLAQAGHLLAAVVFVDALWTAAASGLGSDPILASTVGRAAVFAALALGYSLLAVLSRGGLVASTAGWNGAFEASVGSSELDLGTLYAWAGLIAVLVLCSVLLSGVGLSVAWAVVGFAAVAVGVHLSVSTVRLQGMAVLALTTGKVFLLDTSSLDPVPRILSFIALGVVLLITSLLYARTRADLDLSPFEEAS